MNSYRLYYPYHLQYKDYYKIVEEDIYIHRSGISRHDLDKTLGFIDCIQYDMSTIRGYGCQLVLELIKKEGYFRITYFSNSQEKEIVYRLKNCLSAYKVKQTFTLPLNFNRTINEKNKK